MKNGYTLGLVSVSFRESSPREILEACKKAGLSVIEWGSDVHAPAGDAARLAEIAALQAEYGIACCSYGTYFRLGKTPLGELEHYIAAAKVLGTDILRLWCGTKSGAEMSDAERAALVAACKEAAQIAARAGVTLCMECHMKSFTERVADAVWLMEEVNSPHFRMYWQPFQWQTVSENGENARALAPFATHVHVFNWRGDQKLPLADALEEWQAYLARFSTPRTLLLEFMPDGRLETLCREADALRAIIGGVV
jgi:sugar phosphate isomerase/epimerase